MKVLFVLSMMIACSVWGMQEEHIVTESLDKKTIQELENILDATEEKQVEQVNAWTSNKGLTFKEIIIVAHKADDLGMHLVTDLLCDWISKKLNYAVYREILSGQYSPALQYVVSIILSDIYREKRLKIKKQQLRDVLSKRENFETVMSWLQGEKQCIADASLSFLIKVLLFVKSQPLNDYFFGDFFIVQNIFVEKLSSLEKSKDYNQYIKECKERFFSQSKEPFSNLYEVRFGYYRDLFKRCLSFLYIVQSFPKQEMNIMSFGADFYEKIKKSVELVDYQKIIAEIKQELNDTSILNSSFETLQNLIRSNFIKDISQQYDKQFKTNESIVLSMSHLKLDDIIEEKIKNCGLKSFVDVNETFFNYIKNQTETKPEYSDESGEKGNNEKSSRERIRVTINEEEASLDPNLKGNYENVKNIFIKNLSTLDEKKVYNALDYEKYIQACIIDFFKAHNVYMPFKDNLAQSFIKEACVFLYITALFPSQGLFMKHFGHKFYQNIVLLNSSIALYQETMEEIKKYSVNNLPLASAMDSLENLMWGEYLDVVADQYCRYNNIQNNDAKLDIKKKISCLGMSAINNKKSESKLQYFQETSGIFFSFITDMIDREDEFNVMKNIDEPKNEEDDFDLMNKINNDDKDHDSSSDTEDDSSEGGEIEVGSAQQNNNENDKDIKQDKPLNNLQKDKDGQKPEPTYWNKFTGWLNDKKKWLFTVLGIGAVTVGTYFVLKHKLHQKQHAKD